MRVEHIDPENVQSGYQIVQVDDNNDVTHEVSFREADGEIASHGVDRYPIDPTNRSNFQNEMFNQAARYAEFYFTRTTEHDLLDPSMDPHRLAAVALVIDALDEQTFDRHFGRTFAQLRSHDTGETPPRSLPEGLDPSEVLFYRQRLYLEVDTERLEPLLSTLGEESVLLLKQAAENGVDTLGDYVASSGSEATVTELETSVETASEYDEGDEFSVDALLEGVSGIDVRWDEHGLRKRVDRGVDHHDRTPDATLELFPDTYPTDSQTEFQQALVHHLKCRIRDCYVGIGVTPPEPVRVTGPGQYTYTSWYENYDVYQPYHDPDAEIDWLAPEPDEHRRERDGDIYY